MLGHSQVCLSPHTHTQTENKKQKRSAKKKKTNNPFIHRCAMNPKATGEADVKYLNFYLHCRLLDSGLRGGFLMEPVHCVLSVSLFSCHSPGLG